MARVSIDGIHGNHKRRNRNEVRKAQSRSNQFFLAAHFRLKIWAYRTATNCYGLADWMSQSRQPVRDHSFQHTTCRNVSLMIFKCVHREMLLTLVRWCAHSDGIDSVSWNWSNNNSENLTLSDVAHIETHLYSHVIRARTHTTVTHSSVASLPFNI